MRLTISRERRSAHLRRSRRPRSLAEIARYADGIGVNQNLMIPSWAGSLGAPTALIATHMPPA